MSDKPDAVTWSSLSPPDFAKKTGWLALLVIILGVVLTLMARCAGFVPTEVTFSAQGNTIRLARTTGRAAEYLLMVQPQGWRNTGIRIDPEDEVSFLATGAVNISIQRLIESIDRRHTVEGIVRCLAEPCPRLPAELDSARIRDLVMNIRAAYRTKSAAQRDSIAPEDLIHDPALVQYIMPRYNWVGPDGEKASPADRAYQARTIKKVLPDAAYGALIGFIRAGIEEPSRADFAHAFAIRTATTLFAGEKRASGELWLGVNDVWDEGNPFSNKFYVDNIGSFWVNVKIRHKSGFLGSSHPGE